MTVNTEFIEEWTTALESGKWPQGKSFLNKNGKYCCVGVACELAGIPATPSDGSMSYGDMGMVSSAPDELIAMVGDVTFGTLYARNDGVGCWIDNPQTFAQIAQYLRDTYLQ